MTVDRRTIAGRRERRFDSMRDILDDVESLNGHEVTALGNWTRAQIVQHVDKVIRMGLDGVDYKAPWLIRALARFGKKGFLTKPMKPGFNLPKGMTMLEPDRDVTWDDAVAALRESIEGIDAGRRMEAPSPAFGNLSHDEWVQLQCRHAEMHLSMITPKE